MKKGRRRVVWDCDLSREVDHLVKLKPERIRVPLLQYCQIVALISGVPAGEGVWDSFIISNWGESLLPILGYEP